MVLCHFYYHCVEAMRNDLSIHADTTLLLDYLISCKQYLNFSVDFKNRLLIKPFTSERKYVTSFGSTFLILVLLIKPTLAVFLNKDFLSLLQLLLQTSSKRRTRLID